jgi:hypothetical protein
LAKLHRNIGPDSRLLERGLVDGRSRVGRYLIAIEAELGKQVGNPTFAQRLLIRRTARLLLRLELIDRKANQSDHDLRAASAWENRVRLNLRDLGLHGAPVEPKAPGLAPRGSPSRRNGAPRCGNSCAPMHFRG